ncbi:MAG: putative membrane protein YdfK [Syntrophorhabdus sp. PtaU1.Bin153]|nr:MAG: putative membrane protein YdfK [Syntrophorhabdus sp. PtaU1.Bin153]
MTGTIVNAGAIVAGSLIGLAAGGRIPERVKTILMQALGLSTLIIGLQMALSAREIIPIVGSLLLGALTGELLRIEDGLERVGRWLKKWARSDSTTFVTGFVTTSLLYCTGAMVVVGAIQDGTTGNATTLYIKAMLDGVASIAFASTLGIGVLFSAASVFLVQGSITALSANLVFLQQPAVLGPVTSAGGLLIIAIAINLLNLTKIPIGNFLPALFYAVLFAMM